MDQALQGLATNGTEATKDNPVTSNDPKIAGDNEARMVFPEPSLTQQIQHGHLKPPDEPSVFTFNEADIISLSRMNASNFEESGFCQDTSSMIEASVHPNQSCNNAHINHDSGILDPNDLMKKQHEATIQELMALTSSQPPSTAVSATGSSVHNKYPEDIQQWHDPGFGANKINAARFDPNGFYPGFWRPAYGGYPVSGPSSILSRESSRDDLTSMEGLGQMFEFEDRFRVDRRKLELMMIGRYDPIKEHAMDFFQRIGEETSTTIIWPSRLRIGAKSKKDPHIRIGGLTEDCVKRAKGLIMEHLDTKTTRVTMKMDVSYTDHSHIIGKAGNTIRRVMTETGCHVHFPDSNRSNPNEKSNQVSIAGEMEGVENARARVRELAPLMFNFDLPILSSIDGGGHLPGPSHHHHNDLSDPFVKTMQEQYNIQIMFRQKQKNFPTTVVVVKGCEWESSRVKEATLMLIDYLYTKYTGYPPPDVNGHNILGAIPTARAEQELLTEPDSSRPLSSFVHTVPVSMNVEISPIHHAVVLGKGNTTLRSIMLRTKTTILFPDAADPNIPSIRKGSVSVSGSIHNVYFARQQLLGSLPVMMMFDMPDELDLLNETDIQKLQEELDICISIKAKHRQANKSVLIKAQERNTGAMYKARHLLLGLEGPIVEAVIPETYKMLQQNAGDSFYNLNNHIDPMFCLQIQQKMPFHHGGNGNPYQTAATASGAAALAGLNPIFFQAFQQQLIQNQMAFQNQYSLQMPQLHNPHHYGNAGGVYNHHLANSYTTLQQHHPNVAVSANASAPTISYQPQNSQTGISLQQQFNQQAIDHQRHQQHAVAATSAANLNPQVNPGAPVGYNSLPPNHPYLQDYAHLVLKNITRLQQQENQPVWPQTPFFSVSSL